MDEILLKDSSPEKFLEAEEIVRVMIAMFTKQKTMTPQFTSGAVQPLAAAAYLSNIFSSDEIIAAALFMPRDIYRPKMEAGNVMGSWIELIFQTVEGQFGADTPVPACTPHGEHPIMIFAWARWFIKEYSKIKEEVTA